MYEKTKQDIAIALWIMVAMALGIAIGVAAMENIAQNSIDEYTQCKIACESNRGLLTSYLDGDCVCINGAEFSWEQIKDKRKEFKNEYKE